MSEEVKNYEKAEADYMSGMKYKDIASKYGVSLDTVKSWKKRYGWNRKKGAHKNEKVCTQNQTEKRENKKPVSEEVVEVLENDELTDKQRLFCIIYTRCFNATKAYQKAFNVKYETAAVNGHRMLRNAKIKNEIENLKQNKLNRELLKEEDIVQMYIDILYADITDYVDTRHNLINLNNPLADGRLIKKVSFGKQDSIELMDKMAALKWLSDHMDLATEKQKLEIDSLKRKLGDGEEDEAEKKQKKTNMQSLLEQMQGTRQEDICE